MTPESVRSLISIGRELREALGLDEDFKGTIRLDFPGEGRRDFTAKVQPAEKAVRVDEGEDALAISGREGR